MGKEKKSIEKEILFLIFREAFYKQQKGEKIKTVKKDLPSSF